MDVFLNRYQYHVPASNYNLYLDSVSKYENVKLSGKLGNFLLLDGFTCKSIDR